MRRPPLAIVAIGTLVLIANPSAGVAQEKARIAAASTDLSGALAATTRRVTPAVVQVFTTAFVPGDGVVPGAADLISTQRSSGTGVIVDADGYIVTNAHVVRGAQRLRVELAAPDGGRSIVAPRGRMVNGQMVGIDFETDLAVIKIDATGLPPMAFGDSDELGAGQLVLAFGNPLGLRNSVSLGVVSAVARQLEPDSPMVYIQTDAPINPGSSGGPLVSLDGRLIGINTLIATRTGGHEGIGFSAPSNIVRTVYEQIRKYGRVRRGEIGIRPQTVTPLLAQGLRLAVDRGVVLADVIPGSPAALAGLEPGDVVHAVDGKPMENGRQLQVNLYRRVAGDVVTLHVSRDGRTANVPIAVTERRSQLIGASASPDVRENAIARLGILAINLDERIAALLPTLRGTTGVLVTSTIAGALDARDGGLAPGDVIRAINRTPVQQLVQLRAALDSLKPDDPVVLQIERRGELMYVAFTAE